MIVMERLPPRWLRLSMMEASSTASAASSTPSGRVGLVISRAASPISTRTQAMALQPTRKSSTERRKRKR